MQVVGWIGAILLAYCALPQAVASYRQGHSKGLDPYFLWTWFLGESFMLTHIIQTVGPGGPLFWNYFVNTILVGIILLFKYSPTEPR